MENKEKKYSIVTNPPDADKMSQEKYKSSKTPETPLDKIDYIKEPSLEIPKMIHTPELFSRKLKQSSKMDLSKLMPVSNKPSKNNLTSSLLMPERKDNNP